MKRGSIILKNKIEFVFFKIKIWKLKAKIRSELKKKKYKWVHFSVYTFYSVGISLLI